MTYIDLWRTVLIVLTYGMQISSFLGGAVEKLHISGLCQNLCIQSLIFKPVFVKQQQAGGGGCQLVEEEEEVTHMHWGSIQLTD